MTAEIGHGTDRPAVAPAPGHEAPGDAAGERTMTLAELSAEAERLIRLTDLPVRRVSLRSGNDAVEIDWRDVEPQSATPPAPTIQNESAADADGAADTGDLIQVRAPLVGTFYRSPSPGAPAFVQVGDIVTEGQQVGIVEAMKLMNGITADRRGRVRSISAQDGELVEFDQPLVELDPVDEG